VIFGALIAPVSLGHDQKRAKIAFKTITRYLTYWVLYSHESNIAAPKRHKQMDEFVTLLELR
jgi:hypothetical protein